MKIIVNFKSGTKQSFIVPRDILATEFKNLAETIGGAIRSIEFIQNTKYADPILFGSQETPRL